MTALSFRLICLSLLLVVVTACSDKKSSDAGENQIQPGSQPGESADWGYLPLKITKTYKQQKPLEAAPWHEAGGDWTFLDCELANDPATKVVIGVRAKSAPSGELPFAWGEAMLAVNDVASGTRFVESFGKAFHQEVPPRHGQTPAGFFKSATAVLGSNLARNPDGGFHKKGSWAASKWFLGEEGEVEVFFNYSAEDKTAEFSEKDEEYREALIEQIVVGLRDGPLPERTPENDPNLTLHGPQVTNWTRFATADANCEFSPDSQSLAVSEPKEKGGSTLSLLSVSQPNEPKLLAEFDGTISIYRFLSNAPSAALFVVERLPNKSKTYSSDDPEQLWIVTTTGRQPIVVPPSITNWHLVKDSLSPDGRFLAMTTWRTVSKNRNVPVFHLGNLATGKWQEIDTEGRYTKFAGWKDAEGIVFARSQTPQGEKFSAYKLEPAGGTLSPLEKFPDEFDLETLLSPDGKQSIEVEENKQIILTDIASGKSREFVFHPADKRNAYVGSVEWVSPKYLVFQGARTALINVQNLKMNYPISKESGLSWGTFSPDFKFMIAGNEDGYYLGPVTLVTAQANDR